MPALLPTSCTLCCTELRCAVLCCAALQVRIASGGGRMAVTMDRYEVGLRITLLSCCSLIGSRPVAGRHAMSL